MQRRALLASGALLGTAGCLTDARRQLSGPVRHDHSRATLHSVREPFVDRPWSAGNQARGWLFPAASDDEPTVFTDALGTETAREWNNEVTNENYDDGFVLLLQARSPGTDPRAAAPAFPAEPRWNGWNRVRLPFELRPREAERVDEAADVVSTFLGYYSATATPTSATVVLHEEGDGTQLGARLSTVDAHRWESQ